MRWPRIIFLLIVASLLGAVFHYTVPQRDIVQITDTDVIRTDFSGWNRMFYAQGDSGTATVENRDLRIINAVRDTNGDGIGDRDMVFRNEDTGFGWPPYFKLDSADLHAEATRLSNAGTEQWFALTHYGWRSNLLSIYPNALGFEPVSGPDVRLIPWMPIAAFLMLALIAFVIWRIWERFEDRVINPFVDATAVRWAKLKDRFAGRG
ncbi:DUF1523 family protein [Gymnodinialimonas sp. 2305UL16-5]|uniref:DUF1523 family protein n=1 Tax=Gymnodinialimonas mytili TaxID=3126503 RepID=UPI0030B0E4A3